MGCQSSKTGGAVAPGAAAGPTLLIGQQQAAGEGHAALKLSVLRVEGLRPAEAVFVEVEVEGRPGSKIKTRTATAVAKTQGEGENANRTAEADIRSTLALKAYTEGAAVIFTVKDADPANPEPLGTVTLPGLMIQTKFIGKVPLTGVGEGYEAHLEVNVGERHILVEAAQEITNVLDDTVEHLTQVVAEAKEEVNATVAEAGLEVEQGMADFDMDEVKGAVGHATAEVTDIAKDASKEAKDVVKDGAAEMKVVLVDVVEEVKETDGAVCCRC